MRIRACVAAVTALASLGLAAPAAAHAAAPASPTEDTVTLRLAPADATAYKSLLQTHGLTRADRAAQLARALPSAATRRAVEAGLTSRGLRIVGETDWTITAAAAAPIAQGLTAAAKGRAMTGSDTPLATGAFAGLVTHIVDKTASHIRNHPLFTPAVVDGAGVRSLYGAPIGPATAASQLTVATIQLSGWDESEISSYAGLIGVPDPRPTGQYLSVSVQGADPTAIDATEGNVEVALDQEALLATAPHLRQRAYFATNDGTGFFAALEQVATDATSQPDLGIAALSISWGGCEDLSQPGAQEYYQAMDAAIQDVVAAGVTIFAASGDGGALDCGADLPDAVDFPASDPYVIGVGGTTADAALGQEKAWSLSGGGESTLWPRPAYQTSLTLPGTHRLVPDIAAVGDPDSGFSIYSGGQQFVVGGTSLASPIAAATLATSLASRGFTSGVGYINPNLYGAPASSFRDITVGNNGFAAGPGYDEVTGRGGPLWNRLLTSIDGSPALTAPVYSRTRRIPLKVAVPAGMLFSGWKAAITTRPTCDTTGAAAAPTSLLVPRDGKLAVFVDGLAYNGFCYAATRTVVVDSVVPVATIAAVKVGGTLRIAWRGTDKAPSSGVASYTVSIKRSGTTAAIYSATGTALLGKSVTGVRGKTYTVTVTAKDKAGNPSVAAKRSIVF
ncbi:MAG: kumamolisin [Frankiaceae bacterium]|nr:kumamolisin [Frankiaceae bacterium]